jgi:hypothetical protein
MLTLRATRTVRWLHLWTGMIVSIQIILWVASGLAMVARPIEVVRGDDRRKPVPLLSVPAGLPPLERIELLELGQLLGRPEWKLTDAKGKRLLDAATGAPIAITPATADAIARAGTSLTGPAWVTPADPANPPADWRQNQRVAVELADETRVYGTTQGEIGAIRTPWWRFFDLFWGLHIMDWTERVNSHHPLIITATILSMAVVMTGALPPIRHFGRR